MQHIVSGYTHLVQKEYRRHHVEVTLTIHWERFRKYGPGCTEKWYEDSSPPVTENEQMKLMCDTTLFTDKRLESYRPAVIFLQKSIYEWILIDVTIAWNKNTVKAEQAKIHM